MITTRISTAALFFAALALSACAPRPSGAPGPEPIPSGPAGPAAAPVVAKAPVPDPNPALPAVPSVNGPMDIRVVYPPAGHLIQSKDSNFIFGSIGNGEAGLTINGIQTPVWPNGAFMGWLPNPPASAPAYEIVATTGLDTVRLTHQVKIAPPPTEPPLPPDTISPLSPARYAALIGPAVYASDTDRVVTGYAPAGGIQRWFLIPGTMVKVVGTKGSDAYVMLDSTQTIRIAQSDLQMVDSIVTAPPVRASAFRLKNSAEWTDVVIPVTRRPAYLMDAGPSSLTLTLYETTGPRRRQTPARGAVGSYIESVTSKADGPKLQYTFALKGPVYGYQPLWEDGKFTIRVRRPPQVDSVSPLMGLTIAVDPGHPPIGATGPTGLWEPVPTLEVGLKLRELLQAKGVNVLMTRTTPDPVDLNLRPSMARRANAHALVSIHLNAVPDGVNPLRVQGTATYHYHPHSAALAEAVQKGAVANMGLRDNGVKRENFALVRPTWLPAILVEGAFIIVPEQEAAMRTPEYQERYAKAIVDGLEDYFRGLARARR